MIASLSRVLGVRETVTVVSLAPDLAPGYTSCDSVRPVMIGQGLFRQYTRGDLSPTLIIIRVNGHGFGSS